MVPPYVGTSSMTILSFILCLSSRHPRIKMYVTCLCPRHRHRDSRWQRDIQLCVFCHSHQHEVLNKLLQYRCGSKSQFLTRLSLVNTTVGGWESRGETAGFPPYYSSVVQSYTRSSLVISAQPPPPRPEPVLVSCVWFLWFSRAAAASCAHVCQNTQPRLAAGRVKISRVGKCAMKFVVAVRRRPLSPPAPPAPGRSPLPGMNMVDTGDRTVSCNIVQQRTKFKQNMSV